RAAEPRRGGAVSAVLSEHGDRHLHGNTAPRSTATAEPGLTSFREHLHHHERDIIHRLDLAAEGRQTLADRVSDLVGRARGTFANHFAQTILAVLLAFRVGHFPHPV